MHLLQLLELLGRLASCLHLGGTKVRNEGPLRTETSHKYASLASERNDVSQSDVTYSGAHSSGPMKGHFMASEQKLQNPTAGISFILIGILSISINDMLIKFLSGSYPLHQMVFTRSLIGIGFSLALVQMEGGWRILKTDQPGLHLLRGLLIVVANLTFFTALAVMPLAEATAVFFVAPLMITLLSIPMLGEKVGLMRIGAVSAGFLGVVIMTRPWEADDDRESSLLMYALPVLAAFTYALNNVLTRFLGEKSKASAMAVYIQACFILVSLLFWSVAGDGRFASAFESESLIFLLRAWTCPKGLMAGCLLASDSILQSSGIALGKLTAWQTQLRWHHLNTLVFPWQFSGDGSSGANSQTCLSRLASH